MAGLLQKLKSKVEEIKQEFSATPAESNYDRQIADHVERATSSMLVGPDWGLNFELIDIINNDPQGVSDKVFKAIRRSLLKPNVHTQLLALSLLEACVKNCVPFFFQQLIYADLWHEILRAGEPTRNWDPELRDRALGLVEDFARGLPMPAYKDAYEGLLDRGVDFPVRPSAAAEAGGAPYYTPPPMPAAAVAAEQGISPEDRAAIAAAVADLEAQAAEQAARDAALAPPGLPSAGHVPALMGPAVLMGAPIRPPGYHPPAGYRPPHAAAEQPAMVAGAQPLHAPLGAAPGAAAGAGPGAAQGVPQGREEVEQTLRVSRNSAELLQEMLGPVRAGADRAALQEAFVTDLADQCYRYKSVLAELIPRLTEEDQISGALAANDDLARTLREYEQLLQTSAPEGTGNLGGAGAAAAAAAAAGASSGGAAAGRSSAGGSAAGRTFTLGEEDDDDDELSLQSIRGQQAAGAAGARPAGDMIAFNDAPGSEAGSSAAGAAGPVPAAAAAGEERLVKQMDDLLLGGQTGSSAAGTAPPQ